MSSEVVLSRELAKALSEYSKEVEDMVDEIAREEVVEAVATLKATSPKRKGKYAKNWRFKKNAKGSYVIHNGGRTYRLTHLLENGHILRDGGRSRALPHIKPVEEAIVASFEKRVREGLRK